MLRTVFVASLAILGIYHAAQSAFGALLFYLWLAMFRPEAWVWDAGWLYTLQLSFIGGIYLLLRALTAGLDLRFDLRSLLLFAFLGIAVASTYTSPHSAHASPYVIEFGKVTIIVFLMSRLLTDVTKFRIAMLVVAVSLGFEGAKQGWATLILRPGGININEIPHLGDNNGVAIGMLMCTAMLVGLAQTATNKKEQLILRFLTLGVFYRAISTYSRGGFLSAGAMTIMYVLRSKHRVRSLIAIVVVASAIGAVLPQAFWDRMSTIKVDEDEIEDNSSLSRLHFWRVAVDMASANPLLGVGMNSYNVAFNDYDFSDGFFGRGRSVHSAWFGIVAELGYLGLTFYILIFAFAFIACWRAASRAKRGLAPPELYSLAVALQTSLVACGIGSSFVPWQYNEMYWTTVGFSMALHRLATMSAAKPGAVPAASSPFVVPQGHRRTA